MTTKTTWQAHARLVEKWNNKIRYQTSSSGSNFHRKTITPKLTFPELGPLLLALTTANARKVSFVALLNFLGNKLESARNVYNLIPCQPVCDTKSRIDPCPFTGKQMVLDAFERSTFRKKKKKNRQWTSSGCKDAFYREKYFGFRRK